MIILLGEYSPSQREQEFKMRHFFDPASSRDMRPIRKDLNRPSLQKHVRCQLIFRVYWSIGHWLVVEPYALAIRLR